MSVITRAMNLVRGTVGQWLGRRERDNPEAVYEQAVQERVAQYRRLRDATAGILYLRQKLSRELSAKARELGHVRGGLERAVERDDDPEALRLIARRDALQADLDRIRVDLRDLAKEAETAKTTLAAMQDEIVRLKEERVRMTARLANAQARLRLHRTLDGLGTDGAVRDLETVRDRINQLVTEADLSADLRGAATPEHDDAAAREELAALKRARGPRLLPLVPVGAAH